MLLAGWLVLSALAWPHQLKQQVSTILSGLLVVGLESLYRRYEWAHRATGLVATWVILSMFWIWPRPLTAWNNLLVGLLIAVFSALEGDRLLRPLARRRRA